MNLVTKGTKKEKRKCEAKKKWKLQNIKIEMLIPSVLELLPILLSILDIFDKGAALWSL